MKSAKSADKNELRSDMEFKIPKPLTLEHQELHEELERATKVDGRIGNAAKVVAQILHPHFEKEEEFALPPLGLLKPLTAGTITPEMKEVLTMTDKLKAELPRMLEEHREVVDALAALSDVAIQEKRMEFAHFAKKLILHARAEEEVFYPASILIGEYLKMKLKS